MGGVGRVGRVGNVGRVGRAGSVGRVGSVGSVGTCRLGTTWPRAKDPMSIVKKTTTMSPPSRQVAS